MGRSAAVQHWLLQGAGLIKLPLLAGVEVVAAVDAARLDRRTARYHVDVRCRSSGTERPSPRGRGGRLAGDGRHRGRTLTLSLRKDKERHADPHTGTDTHQVRMPNMGVTQIG